MTLNEPTLGVLSRVKAAGKVLLTGKQPNPAPLSQPPRDRSRANLVTELNDWVIEERKFWKPVFDRIRQEQKFAAGQQWINSKKNANEHEDYVGDMVQQLVNRKTAALYSKNPSPEAVIRERMDFTVWDGNQATIEACKQLIGQVAPAALQAHQAELQGQAVPPPPPQMQQELQQAQAILEDYNQGMQAKAMLEKVAATGEKLIKQQLDAQSPDTLICAKQAVSQVITSRVGYVKVIYKRDMETVPTETANVDDFDEKLEALRARLHQLEHDTTSPDDAQVAEAKLLRQSIADQEAQMQQMQEVPSDEGVVLDWLSATSVIIDRRCKCLKEFIGAHRIAHEILMTVGECEARFNVSLRDSGAKLYSETPGGWASQDRSDYENDDKGNAQKRAQQKVCVWLIEDKDTGMRYVLCDGVKDFLKEPETNEPEVNRFWSIVAITFNAQVIETNDPDNDVTIYPRSDVRLMMPMQVNVNVAGNEKRKHRAANRPAWVGVKSKFASAGGISDLERLARPRDAHDVFMLENLQPGEKIEDYLQPLPKQPFDQNLYDNAADTQAMMQATGMQASDIGEQRPDEKATGQNIAAQARATSESSNIDDLNFALGAVVQMMWEMLVQEMPLAEVQKRVGRGAVWPEISRQQIAEAIFFRIEAGSMGRPNQAAELQKIQVLGPQIMALLQQLGKSPEPLLKLILKTWDANIDLDELLKDAQVLPPPQPPAEQPKPPSLALSMNFKDAPPEVQPQIEEAFGFKPAPAASHVLNKVGLDKAVESAHHNKVLAAHGVPPGTPPPAAAPGPPAGR
ncbi:MAG: hypothetical protein KGL39_15690 [Patescibacteria group bacterium]|nr:hypothetical protein [Patescibacteria group bacterium]